jgi:hypothetical protein
MAITLRSIPYHPKTDHHYGTSDDQPHQWDKESLVQPASVDRAPTTDLFPEVNGGKWYSKLYENLDAASLAAGPRYYGVAFPFGITDITTVNIFFHPDPEKLPDAQYVGLSGAWVDLYRYVQIFGIQLAANTQARGSTNMVLVMPIFSNATWNTLGSFRDRWREIVNGILVEVQKVAWPDLPGQTMPRNQSAMRNIILSDFSAGRLAMTNFRYHSNVGDVLREIWDFDGKNTMVPTAPEGGQALIYDQHSSPFRHNLFHVPPSRWWRNFPTVPRADAHGDIPRALFYHATTVSSYGH